MLAMRCLMFCGGKGSRAAQLAAAQQHGSTGQHSSTNWASAAAIRLFGKITGCVKH
jgi:hypothetical protein